MPNFSKTEIVPVHYPFSDLTSSKVRPAVIVSAPHSSQDLFVVADQQNKQFICGRIYPNRLEEIRLERRNGGKTRNFHDKRNARQKARRKIRGHGRRTTRKLIADLVGFTIKRL